VKSPKKIPEISQVKSNIKPVKLNKNGQPRKKRVYTDAQREAERMKKAVRMAVERANTKKATAK